jgi:uncharacterized small protein (DUF1192 family)
MSDKIELGEPDAIRNEDNILWLRAEIERLEADAENLRNTITSMHLSLKERDAEIDRLRAALENDSG